MSDATQLWETIGRRLADLKAAVRPFRAYVGAETDGQVTLKSAAGSVGVEKVPRLQGPEIPANAEVLVVMLDDKRRIVLGAIQKGAPVPEETVIAIADVDGLQAALDGKSGIGHTHTVFGELQFVVPSVADFASLPTASVTYRGQFRRTLAAGGDVLYICERLSGGTYQWTAVT